MGDTRVYPTYLSAHTLFDILQKALEDIGMSGREIFDVFRIVAGVLKLGNVEFVPTTNMDGTEGCAVSNDYGNEGRREKSEPPQGYTVAGTISRNLLLAFIHHPRTVWRQFLQFVTKRRCISNSGPLGET